MSALSSLAASAVPATDAPTKRLYKSTSKFLNVITPKGKPLYFRHGMHITEIKEDIAYLDAEIESGAFNGSIFIDPNARTISEEEANPMLALRKKLFAEFLAEQQAQLNPSNDMGTSTQKPLNAMSTSDIAPTTAGGNASARLIPVNPK